ncbi:hypothetical protein KCP69_14835 [Salmonella enterica subsp. enterica]|nr:hypothetical protein KCP69_14835 [Salmonella enterica subsp. enterica]
MKTLFQKTSVQIHNGFVITLFTMSLAMTPPEQGGVAAAGVVAHIMSIEQLLPSGRWRCLVVCFSVAQYRYPDRRQLIQYPERECS